MDPYQPNPSPPYGPQPYPSPVYGPQPYPSPPYGPQPPPYPPHEPQPYPYRVRNAVLAGVVALLALALAGTGAILGVTRSRLQDQASSLKRSVDIRGQARAQAAAGLAEDFRQADLNGKLQRVHTLTEAANQALSRWVAEGTDADTINAVVAAQNACDDAVIDYDATAAQFPPAMLLGLPTKIDMQDSATDCGL